MDCTQKRQHATANRANKKASCDPSQSFGSNLVTTSNAVSPRYQEGKRYHGTGPSNKHIVHPATIHPSLQYASNEGRVSQGGRPNDDKWSEYSDPRCTTGTRQNFPSGVMRNNMSHSTAVHTDNREMSACSAHRALGSTSEVSTPSCSRALTRLRNTKTHRT